MRNTGTTSIVNVQTGTYDISRKVCIIVENTGTNSNEYSFFQEVYTEQLRPIL